MIYCISDIHGEYEKFMKMLKLIDLKDDDTLYILGDVFDRGDHPIKTLLKIMELPNAVFILGNHELMALEVMKYGLDKIVETEMDCLDDDAADKLLNWYQNGCISTIKEYRILDEEQKKDVYEYLLESYAYKELELNGQKYLLVHAGLMNFDPETDISEYALWELVWARPDYGEPYFEDIITVVGHTPTQTIFECDAPGRIFKKNNFIVIDCGVNIDGTLGCLRLDDMKEFYVD